MHIILAMTERPARKPQANPPAPEFVAVAERASQAEVDVDLLLAKTGIARTTWWRWSLGETEPRLKTLRKLEAELTALGA
jgi:transcriptional regulator with XRE-family HTH domain